MNKDLIKFIFKLIILFLLVWGIFAVVVRNFGMYVYDEEYASYKETLDYVNNKMNDNSEVLIFGDSTAKAAIIPELIHDKTYNLAMAGSTPIESYYMFENYLINHKKPKTVILMYYMAGLDVIGDFFWDRTVYFDCLKYKEFQEIYQTGLFPDKNGMFKFMEYKLCLPNKYYAPLKNALLEDRYEINAKEYKTSKKNRGQHYFGTKESFAPDNVPIKSREHFKPLPIVELYLNKIIQVCIDNDINVIIEQHPINLSTKINMQESFRLEYVAFMEKLQSKYPSIKVNTEINVQPDTWFGDFIHCNKEGATGVTNNIANKYIDILAKEMEVEFRVDSTNPEEAVKVNKVQPTNITNITK